MFSTKMRIFQDSQCKSKLKRMTQTHIRSISSIAIGGVFRVGIFDCKFNILNSLQVATCHDISDIKH